jgi:hypothetical protein
MFFISLTLTLPLFCFPAVFFCVSLVFAVFLISFLFLLFSSLIFFSLYQVLLIKYLRVITICFNQSILTSLAYKNSTLTHIYLTHIFTAHLFPHPSTVVNTFTNFVEQLRDLLTTFIATQYSGFAYAFTLSMSFILPYFQTLLSCCCSIAFLFF